MTHKVSRFIKPENVAALGAKNHHTMNRLGTMLGLEIECIDINPEVKVSEVAERLRAILDFGDEPEYNSREAAKELVDVMRYVKPYRIEQQIWVGKDRMCQHATAHVSIGLYRKEENHPVEVFTVYFHDGVAIEFVRSTGSSDSHIGLRGYANRLAELKAAGKI